MTTTMQAVECFAAAFALAPYLVQGMAVYSTTLWHLKREAQLSRLAQQLIALDRQAPQTWCAVGNCFSLARDHELALRFFRRAAQLDPHFAYSHTLAGHEAVASDDSEVALSHFRTAIRIDPRHYNAWYGLGTVYYRQEQYALAEYHFRRALAVNPQSSVLSCYVGMALQARDQLADARAMLDRAVQLTPTNTMARFKRASVIAAMGEYELALNQLEELRDTLPKEAPVFFLLGQVNRCLGRPARAVALMRQALDLDPRHSNFIRSMIEKLEAQIATADPNAGDEFDGVDELNTGDELLQV